MRVSLNIAERLTTLKTEASIAFSKREVIGGPDWPISTVLWGQKLDGGLTRAGAREVGTAPLTIRLGARNGSSWRECVNQNTILY